MRILTDEEESGPAGVGAAGGDGARDGERADREESEGKREP